MASSSVVLADAIQMMKMGSALLKYGSSGQPHFRQFQLSADGKRLMWFSPKKTSDSTQVAIRDVIEIQKGQFSDKFKRQKRLEFQHLSFSLRYTTILGQVDTLDIVCKDQKEYDCWFYGLEHLIKESKTMLPSQRESQASDDLDAIAALGFSSTVSSGKKRSVESDNTPSTVSIRQLRERIQDANDVYLWGSNEFGQIAAMDDMDRSIPYLTELLLGKDVRTVAMGNAHTAVALDTGQVYAWGCTGASRLGVDKTEASQDEMIFEPRLVLGFPASRRVQKISCGDYHTVAVTEDFKVYGWGSNVFGQLGVGDEIERPRPTLLEAFRDTQILSTACGPLFTAAIAVTGELFTWGFGDKGVLGHCDSLSRNLPTQVAAGLTGKHVRHISCGDHHMAAGTDTEVFTWGWGGCGQLGHGDEEDKDEPWQINEFLQREVLMVACGAAHTCALIGIPKVGVTWVYSWGYGESGALGHGDEEARNKPTVIVDLKEKAICHIACGSYHSAAVSENGEVYTWGMNDHGQLGLGNLDNTSRPRLVEFLKEKGVQQVVCGGSHTGVTVARSWVADKDAHSCMQCKTQFTLFTRRHHCRNCGGVFCGKCTTKRYPLLKLGYSEPVRVCDSCYDKLRKGLA
eukprot:GILJ01002363.1.p1 GENE.GILJ01002363.1~~GILJ01002363.1.p1  ORF type:complete len:646 (-),score=71.18 GILJ01002363.1:240-2123(-)